MNTQLVANFASAACKSAVQSKTAQWAAFKCTLPTTVLPPLRRSLTPLGKGEAGFTLIEITLCIAVIAFAFVTLLGLLQSGFSTFSESVERSVASQIAQAIMNEKRMVDFTTLTSSTAPVVTYYNEEGDPQTDPAKIIYAARVAVTSSVSVPGPKTGRTTNRSLARVSVEVIRKPGGGVKATDKVWEDSKTAKQYFAYIPRT